MVSAPEGPGTSSQGGSNLLQVSPLPGGGKRVVEYSGSPRELIIQNGQMRVVVGHLLVTLDAEQARGFLAGLSARPGGIDTLGPIQAALECKPRGLFAEPV